MFEVRFCMMFKVDGLDLEGVIKDLNKIGTVTEVSDDMLLGDGPVKLIFITSDFAGFTKVKLKYNCATAEDSEYFLIPMASLEDKLTVQNAQK